MAKRTCADYEQVIKMAYDGYTAEGISGATKRSASAISGMLFEMGLTFKEIRAAKRSGQGIANIIASVDWSFVAKKEYGRQKSAKSGAANLQKARASASSIESDIAEIKRMVNDIYDAITKPGVKPGFLNRVNGALRADPRYTA